jgi:hypothetical protein
LEKAKKLAPVLMRKGAKNGPPTLENLKGGQKKLWSDPAPLWRPKPSQRAKRIGLKISILILGQVEK